MRKVVPVAMPLGTISFWCGQVYSSRGGQFLGSAEVSRQRAFALAAQSGQVETTRILLDAGEDANRFNPPGTHGHSSPLHQAALAGHLEVVRLLVERGARLDIRDTVHHATPLGWAEHGNQPEIAEYLTNYD